MKNIVIILGSLLLFSCTDNVVLTQEEYKQLKNEPIPEYPKHFELYDDEIDSYESGICLGSDEHEYLVIDNHSHGKNISHYVDCKLCKPQENGSKDKKIKY